MPTRTDQHVGSAGAIVSPADTSPARVEASPSSALRGTAEAQDGNKPATHTPTPWLMETGRLGAACVYAPEEYRGKQRNRLFCQVQGGPDTPRAETIANAEFIVRAVNNHYRLINALKNTHMCATYDQYTGKCGGCLVSTLLADVEAR